MRGTVITMLLIIIFHSCDDPVRKKLVGAWTFNKITFEYQNPYISENVIKWDVCRETIYRFEVYPSSGSLYLTEDGEYLLSLKGYFLFKERSAFCPPIRDSVEFKFSDRGIWFYVENNLSIQLRSKLHESYTCLITDFDGETISLDCSGKIEFSYPILYLDRRKTTANSFQATGNKIN